MTDPNQHKDKRGHDGRPPPTIPNHPTDNATRHRAVERFVAAFCLLNHFAPGESFPADEVVYNGTNKGDGQAAGFGRLGVGVVKGEVNPIAFGVTMESC